MGRDIKFRQFVWEPNDRTKDKMLSWEDLLNDEEESLTNVFTTKFSNASELMQYTGLKDKNGVEIYEGDIICIYDGGEYGYYEPSTVITKVELDSDYCGFILRQDNKDKLYFDDEIGADSFEIIGNIYQNPELIGGETK